MLDNFSISREFVTDPDLILPCILHHCCFTHEQLGGMLEFVMGLLEKLEDSQQQNAQPFTLLEVRVLIAIQARLSKSKMLSHSYCFRCTC